MSVRGGPRGVCTHWRACSSVRAGDSVVPCSQPALPSRCCEDDALPSWRGRTRWCFFIFYFFALSHSLSLDGALTLPWAAIRTTETCSGPWKAASLRSPDSLPLLMPNSLMPSREIWLRAIYGLAFAKANKRARPSTACVLPVCLPQLTMQRSALCFLLPLTVTVLSFTLSDYCELDLVSIFYINFLCFLNAVSHWEALWDHLFVVNKIYLVCVADVVSLHTGLLALLFYSVSLKKATKATHNRPLNVLLNWDIVNATVRMLFLTCASPIMVLVPKRHWPLICVVENYWKLKGGTQPVKVQTPHFLASSFSLQVPAIQTPATTEGHVRSVSLSEGTPS